MHRTVHRGRLPSPVPPALAAAHHWSFAMPSSDPEFPLSTLQIEPWLDPLVDGVGHDPRSPYVERFWLVLLGPSTSWLLRRLADRFDAEPEGYTLDLGETATAIGVGNRGGRNSPFMRSIERSCRFGAARFLGAGTLAVRRKLAPLSARQVSRLPVPLQREHQAWLEQHAAEATAARPTASQVRDRARQLARSLVELGEDPAATEAHLHRWRFHPAVASEAVRWARANRATPGPSAATPDGPARLRRAVTETSAEASPAARPARVAPAPGRSTDPGAGPGSPHHGDVA